MSAKHAMLCAHCGIQFETDKDWPIQTCSICWRDGWSVTKAGKVYQKKDKAAALFTAKPAAAAPAPAATTTKLVTSDEMVLFREIAQSEARIAMNTNEILSILARIEKLLGPHQADMDLYPSDPAGGSP